MNRTLLVVAILCCSFLYAQDNKPRVFITDSHSWEVGSGGGGAGDIWGSGGSGGARPQTAEIVKTFGQRCPAVVTNNIKERSDYIVVLDHEGGKVWWEHDSKVAVFERITGDTVVSKSTLSLGGSVQTACEAITRHWSDNSGRLTTARLQQPVVQAAAPGVLIATSKPPLLSVISTPDGADIEVDGSFMGNTPSSLELPKGDHEVVIKKAGYKDWRRTLKIAGGEIKITADLEKRGS